MSLCPVDFKQCQCDGRPSSPCLAVESLRKDAERWRKLRDTPATAAVPGPLRGWLFMRPGGADSLDRMADDLPAVGDAQRGQ